MLLSVLFAGILSWNDISDFPKVSLTQNIKFSRALLPKGSEYQFISVQAASDGAPVLVMDLRALRCSYPGLYEKMVLIRIPSKADFGINSQRTVGVEMFPGCNIKIFIEASDYYAPSFFQSYRSGFQ